MSDSEEGVPNILRPDGTVDIAAAAKAPYQILATGGATGPGNRLYWGAVALLITAVLYILL